MDLLSVPDLFADSCDLFADVTTPLQPMHRLAPPLIDHRLPDLTFIALQDRVKVCGVTGLTEREKDLYRHALINAKRADAATVDAEDPRPPSAPAPMFSLPSYQAVGSAKVFAAVVSDSPPPEAASTIAQVMSRLLDRQLEVRLLRSEVGQAPLPRTSLIVPQSLKSLTMIGPFLSQDSCTQPRTCYQNRVCG